MIRCIFISPNADLRQTFTQALRDTPGVELLRTLDHHPLSSEAGRLLDSLHPDAVFVDAGQPLDARETGRRLEELAPNLPLIGVDWSVTSGNLLRAMQAGFQDFVAFPFTPDRLKDALDRASEHNEGNRERNDANRVYSFLPAKCGAGSSTIAINTAIALAARNDGESLLLDLDFASGVVGFSLKLEPAEAPATPAGAETADSVWHAHLRRHGSLDVVPAAVHPSVFSATQHTRNLLRTARTNYKACVVDLPSELNEESRTALRQSQMIFLVTTPELASLKLAHERIEQLAGENLADRVELVVNRAGPVRREQIEDLLGCPVYYEFPNNYQAINAALQKGIPVGPMAGQFRRFAGMISGDPWVREELPPRRWSDVLNDVKRAFTRPVL